MSGERTTEPGSGRCSYLLPPVRSDGDFASNAKYFSNSFLVFKCTTAIPVQLFLHVFKWLKGPSASLKCMTSPFSNHMPHDTKHF